MFKVSEIKNAHRRGTDKEKRKPAIGMVSMFKHWPCDNKPMPYFSIVPEQVQRDKRYQNLAPDEQGHFLRMCLWLQGPGRRGMCANFAPEVAAALNMDVATWSRFQFEFLNAKLLIKSSDGNWLIQPELREQCLHYAATEAELQEIGAHEASDCISASLTQ